MQRAALQLVSKGGEHGGRERGIGNWRCVCVRERERGTVVRVKECVFYVDVDMKEIASIAC